MGGEEVILVADPAAAQQVLIDKAAIYKKVWTWSSSISVLVALYTAERCTVRGCHIITCGSMNPSDPSDDPTFSYDLCLYWLLLCFVT